MKIFWKIKTEVENYLDMTSFVFYVFHSWVLDISFMHTPVVPSYPSLPPSLLPIRGRAGLEKRKKKNLLNR